MLHYENQLSTVVLALQTQVNTLVTSTDRLVSKLIKLE